MVRTIDLDDDLDRQRYRCPNGHARWEAWDSYLYCWSCADTWDVDPKFDELLDKKTGEKIPRSKVKFVRGDASSGQAAD